jgi:hypothetical protein
MRELRPNVIVEGVEVRRVETLDVLINCIDEYGEGQVLLEFRGRAGEHELPALLRARRELCE